VTVESTEPTVKESVPRFPLDQAVAKRCDATASGLGALRGDEREPLLLFSAVRRPLNGKQQIRCLEAKPSPSSRKQPPYRRRPKFPSEDITLADPIGASGPVSTMKKRPIAPVWFPGRPCNLCATRKVDSAKSGQGRILCSSDFCLRSLGLRTYLRTATDALGKALPTLLSHCGWAGKGECTGFWDVAQNHTRARTGAEASFLAGLSPRGS